jgi:hypothetical protein
MFYFLGPPHNYGSPCIRNTFDGHFNENMNIFSDFCCDVSLQHGRDADVPGIPIQYLPLDRNQRQSEEMSSKIFLRVFKIHMLYEFQA